MKFQFEWTKPKVPRLMLLIHRGLPQVLWNVGPLYDTRNAQAIYSAPEISDLTLYKLFRNSPATHPKKFRPSALSAFCKPSRIRPPVFLPASVGAVLNGIAKTHVRRERAK